MRKAIFGYKIMFTFYMPDGSKNGGLCNHPASIQKVFKMVEELGGVNLVIEDQTIYKEMADNVTTCPKCDGLRLGEGICTRMNCHYREKSNE